MAQDSVSKGALWTGRVMSAFPILIVLMGSVMKLMRLPACTRASPAPGFQTT